jgi:asparagine synthase (glutamine-hydrolysing)
MCRVAGVISKQKKNYIEQVQKMLTTMERGGPDDSGIFSVDNVCLGHNRLAIIDISKDGAQPMKSFDENIVLSFNGEIYNYQEIRQKLQKLGLLFRSNSDTEVIIRAYECWGIKCVSLFEGIFSFSLFDRRNNKLFLVRDYPGVKPLYYSLSDSRLVFASEVKAFEAFGDEFSISNQWEVLFLSFGFLPYPYTTYTNVFELAPGSVLELAINEFSVKTHTFFEIENNKDYFSATDDVILNLVKEATEKAFQKNLISDAPLGVFLSGGLDSSIIALFTDKKIQSFKTISVNFDESAYDETSYQRDVLKRTKHAEHTAHRISQEMFQNGLPEFWQALDQPTVDGINAFFVSKCAKNEGLKAVLSGIGADELFGGYISFRRVFLMKVLKLLPFKKGLSRVFGFFRESFSRVIYLDLNSPIGDYLFLRGIFCPGKIAELAKITEEEVYEIITKVHVKTPFNHYDAEYVSFLESKLYMRNQLLRDFDTMGMWHGLEIRVPFLDIQLTKLLGRIRPEFRFKGNKYLLRTIFAEMVPQSILKRRKKGFTFPFGVWLRNSVEQFFDINELDEDYLKVRSDFLKGKSHWSKLWALIVRNQFKRKIGIDRMPILSVDMNPMQIKKISTI